MMLGSEEIMQSKRHHIVHTGLSARSHHVGKYVAVDLVSKGLANPFLCDEIGRKWWKKKADEIYQRIPDFGGFLVKANAEGQPGPLDYGRTHAEGANMLADALAPHGGIVMWRSFVYGAKHKGEDRVMQAVSE